MPDFRNNSYLELPTLKNAKHAFSVEMWFYPRSLNGVLLYNGQMLNRKGDFITVNLENGYANFIYNLGSGTANITSRKQISLNEWHSIKISRLRRQGTLKVDNETVVVGKSKPPLAELNLSLPLYIGGIPHIKYIHKDCGVVKGFDGAIQKIVFNGDDWTHLTSKATKTFGIKAYKGFPCISGTCFHGGVCVPEFNLYKCRCPQKYIGKRCEKRIRGKDLIQAIYFSGRTFLTFPYTNTKGSRRRKSNRFQVRFRTSSSSGLLFWINKGSHLNGDYLAAAIVGGFPELSFNLGKQEKYWSIKSDQRVDDGLWHTVTFHRKKRLGEVRVDKNHFVSNVSETGATDLNTDSTLWIGGSPKLPTGLPYEYYKGFTGCIDSIIVDKSPIHHLLSIKDGVELCNSQTPKQLQI